MAHLARQPVFRPALHALAWLLVMALGAGSAGIVAAQPIDGLAAARAIANTFPQALERTSGSIPEAAKLLGIGRATLYRKVDEYGIER